MTPGGTLSERNLAINPDELAPAIGYSHAVLAASGRTIYLAGQIAFDNEGRIVGDTWVDQFDLALSNLVTALVAAGGEPEHLVWMQIFTSDVAAYRTARPELGPIYRRHLGRHFPAMGLYGVTELADIGALVEITAIAVVPD
jgi:enamine deaminase RidA (YjgF/YER057c/UK114 family)